MLTGILKTAITSFALFWVPGTVSLPDDTIADMQKYGVEIEIVKEIEGFPNAAAYTRFSDYKVFMDIDFVRGQRFRSDTLAAHEFIHILRKKHGLWLTKFNKSVTFNLVEEAIAVVGTVRMATELFGDNRYSVNEKKALRAYGINEFDRELVEEEIEKTMRLFNNLK